VNLTKKGVNLNFSLIKFLVKKSFNIQELLTPQVKSRYHGTKPMHPSSSSGAFQRQQEHDLSEASSLSGSHNYKTKQTTFLHR
jgi:hypothetical protein